MGVKDIINKAGKKAADGIAKLAVLSPEQLAAMEAARNEYLTQVPQMDDDAALELTSRLLAAGSIEIYNEYLQHIDEMYAPVRRDYEYNGDFQPSYNIRFIKITKWVTDQKENSLEKLVNVYEVLSNERCNIALVFHRKCEKTDVYLAVTNTKNADGNVDVDNYKTRLKEAIKGNFPGAEWSEKGGSGILPCLNNDIPYSVACASNIPGEKSEKFISQTIEKLLDGIVPDDHKKEYTVILLATPVRDIDAHKLHLAELYSALAPYAGWQTGFTYTQSDSTNSTATFGVNAGVSAGVQHGQNSTLTNSTSETDSTNRTDTDSTSETDTETTGKSEGTTEGTATTDGTSSSTTNSTSRTESTSSTHSENTSTSHTDSKGSSDTVGGSVGGSIGGKANAIFAEAEASVNASVNYSHGWSKGASDTASKGFSDAVTQGVANTTSTATTEGVSHAVTSSVAKTATKMASSSIGKTIGQSVANSLGHAVTKGVSTANGISKAVNLGGNFGANFARSSNVTAMVGKNENITQTFTNYTIKHTLALLEGQMKRYDESTALGMWDFAAYVLSEDQNTASNVAHSYLALTQGEQSFLSQTAVNLWRGDIADNDYAREICGYLRELRHPVFGFRPVLVEEDSAYFAYPPIVTAATMLSGKELAYSLNFPQHSIAGLPVIECAEFGRNVVSYQNTNSPAGNIALGNIFHMNHSEAGAVNLKANSLTSHTFITGSTGSGKSNTVYQLLDEATDKGIKFLVVEPAKGEYKSMFGGQEGVSVYGTNPELSSLLHLNPFCFEKGIHVYEHLDRLVEIFNVCWPMYAAMPAVLKNAIEKSYMDCGWNMAESTNPYGDGLFPCFADVARNIRTILDSSEYDAENKGAYKGSLLTRLESLTNGINGMIFTDDEIPSAELFDQNVIVDLSRIGSTETKSLIMGILVLKLQEHRISAHKGSNSPLKHITVLEEAHNLLKRSSTPTAEGADMVGKSVEMLANAIAEMRTYGEGFIIVDQAPGLLDMAAIRNTNTKIIMRLPDQSDRELVGRSANLNDDQITELAKLPCGVAAVYQNEWVQPVLCKVKECPAPAKAYNYVKPAASPEATYAAERIQIAALLSNGTKVELENALKDIRPILQQLKLSASNQVSALKMMINPPREPRMTKLAPIMMELFPTVTKAVRESYLDAYSPREWTIDAELALQSITESELEAQVRRDIIQGIMTGFFLREVRNAAALQDWSKNGGLR